jgi:hypothetical protein
MHLQWGEGLHVRGTRVDTSLAPSPKPGALRLFAQSGWSRRLADVARGADSRLAPRVERPGAVTNHPSPIAGGVSRIA